MIESPAQVWKPTSSFLPSAEFERELIRARTSEGRSRAKAGVKLGRTPMQQREASHSTISRLSS
jgi:DNA invertase Pin-like site-specific DNA recombinase